MRSQKLAGLQLKLGALERTLKNAGGLKAVKVAQVHPVGNGRFSIFLVDVEALQDHAVLGGAVGRSADGAGRVAFDGIVGVLNVLKPDIEIVVRPPAFLKVGAVRPVGIVVVQVHAVLAGNGPAGKNGLDVNGKSRPGRAAQHQAQQKTDDF